MAMTHDEAHRRAIEAANEAFWATIEPGAPLTETNAMTAAITAYLAAMVLPISERGDNMGTACISLIGDQWTLSPLPAATHVFFLPKVTK